MPDYRIYVVGLDGHFSKSITLQDCPDDQSAVETAQRLIDGYDVEVWQYARKIAVLDHRTKQLKKDWT